MANDQLAIFTVPSKIGQDLTKSLFYATTSHWFKYLLIENHLLIRE